MEERLQKLVVAVALGVFALAGCGKKSEPLPGAGASSGQMPGAQTTPPDMSTLPQGHPPISQEAPAGALALKPTGIGSQAELDRVIASLKDPALHALFEDGFRRCFTSDQSARDYRGAAEAMNEVLAKVPDFAPALRVLAYTKLNTGDMMGSTELYRKAVEVDPTYGEAHYALAFMLTQTDPVEGRKHFEKAMELGVPDERDLRSKFYPSGT